jgi:hypothetical protein
LRAWGLEGLKPRRRRGTAAEKKAQAGLVERKLVMSRLDESFLWPLKTGVAGCPRAARRADSGSERALRRGAGVALEATHHRTGDWGHTALSPKPSSPQALGRGRGG